MLYINNLSFSNVFGSCTIRGKKLVNCREWAFFCNCRVKDNFLILLIFSAKEIRSYVFIFILLYLLFFFSALLSSFFFSVFCFYFSLICIFCYLLKLSIKKYKMKGRMYLKLIQNPIHHFMHACKKKITWKKGIIVDTKIPFCMCWGLGFYWFWRCETVDNEHYLKCGILMHYWRRKNKSSCHDYISNNKNNIISTSFFHSNILKCRRRHL